MTTYGAQMDRKWTGSGAEVGRKWTGSGLEVDRKLNARDLQAQGAYALWFFGLGLGLDWIEVRVRYLKTHLIPPNKILIQIWSR